MRTWATHGPAAALPRGPGRRPGFPPSKRARRSTRHGVIDRRACSNGTKQSREGEAMWRRPGAVTVVPLFDSIGLRVTLAVAVCIAMGAVMGAGPVGAQSPAQSRGRSLVIVQMQDPHNWDPIAPFLLSWGMVCCNLFIGLLDRTPDLVLWPG